jgi:hypothetical protein
LDGTTTDCGALSEVVVFLNHFNDLPDPRQRGKVIYPLDEILLLSLLAVLAGADSFVEMRGLAARNARFSSGSGRSSTARRRTITSVTSSPP